MANVAPPGLNQFLNANGTPVALGTLSTFDAGMSTPRITWSDSAETTPNANPIVLDSAGRAAIYYRGNYKLVLKDFGGATLWTFDNFNVPDLSTANGAIQWQIAGSNVGTAGQFTTVNFASNLAAATPSGSVLVVTIGGSGTVTFGGLVVNGAAGASITGGPFSSRGFADNATAAKWNIDSTGRLLNNGASQCRFYARRITTAQNTGNVCIYNTEDYDIGAGYDPNTGIYTVPVAGTWIFTAGAVFGNTSGGTITNELSIRKGIPISSQTLIHATGLSLSVSTTSPPILLAVSDAIDVRAAQVMSATYTMGVSDINQRQSFFAGYLLS